MRSFHQNEEQEQEGPSELFMNVHKIMIILIPMEIYMIHALSVCYSQGNLVQK